MWCYVLYEQSSGHQFMMTVQYILRTGTKGSCDIRLPWHLKFSFWDQVFSRSKWFYNINKEENFKICTYYDSVCSIFCSQTRNLSVGTVSSLQKYGTGLGMANNLKQIKGSLHVPYKGSLFSCGSAIINALFKLW